MHRVVLLISLLFFSACALFDANQAGSGDAARDGGPDARVFVDASTLPAPDAAPPPPPIFTSWITAFGLEGATAIAILDTDGDGREDLVFADDARRIRRVDTTEPFPHVDPVAVLDLDELVLEHLVRTDLNGNGQPDLVGTAGTKVVVALDFPQATPAFVSFDATLVPAITGLAVGDLNADQRPDLLLMTESASAYVLFQTPAGGGELGHTPLEIPLGALGARVGIADVDGDGGNDLIFPDRSMPVRVASVLQKPARGQFFPRQTFASDLDGFDDDVLVADLDGRDGPEVTVIAGRWPRVYNASGTGSSLITQEELSAQVTRIASSEADGDSRRELLVLTQDQSSTLHVYEQSGALDFRLPPELYGFGNVVVDLAVGDLDGDGRDDVALLGLGQANLLLSTP